MKFSLKSVLFIVTCAAVYFSITFSLPITIGFYSLCVLSFWLPALFAAAVVYGRGALRAFALGCFFGTIPLLGYLCLFIEEIVEYTNSLLRNEAKREIIFSFGYVHIARLRTHLLIGHAFVAANGFSVAICRWLLQRRSAL